MTLLLSTVLLALAWFAAANVAISLLACRLARDVGIEVDDPGRADARRLLILRLMPALGAAIFSAALFTPAHLWLEPREPGESFGVAVYALALMTLGLLIRGAWRAGAVLRAAHRLRRWTRTAAPIPDRNLDAVEIAGLHGISLVGVLGPRVLVGRSVRKALTAAELDVALAHESAHQRTHDNLARVLMYCAPDLFGATAAGRRLEGQWRAAAEARADAAAAGGDPIRAAALASALVKVARMADERAPLCSPAWSAFHEPGLLASRVRRLLAPDPPVPERPSHWWRGTVALVGGVAVAWLAGAPPALHRLTELLIRTLP